MIKVILEVSCDKDIAEQRWIAYELSAAKIHLQFCDGESHEVVENLYFDNGEFSWTKPL